MDLPAWVGLILTGMFLAIKLGIFKSWFILKTLPGLMSARMFYALFPVGLGLIGIMNLPDWPGYSPDKLSFTILGLIFVWGGPLIGFWFMYSPPKWIKPRWLQWLEREYGYCLPILVEEAQKMNRWTWEAKVRTRAGMQEWIDDIFIHRQEDLTLAWQAEKYYRVVQQTVKQKTYVIKAGMAIEDDVPIHRQDDIVLTQEEIDTFFASDNDQYRMADEYKSD